MHNGLRELRSRVVLCAALAAVLTVGLCAPPPAESDDGRTVFMREEFDSLGQWKPLKFRKISNMSTYTLERINEKESCLRAQSSNSASGMVWKGEFDVYEHPGIQWRWKISNTYEKGDAATKGGDDYPMRIYVMFKYDPADPQVKRKFNYGLARLLYGEYPPYTSLIYIWANRQHQKRYIPNPYTSEAMMVPLRSGSGLAGQWLVENVNILDDYRAAFGTDPPRKASLAFMNDSDNTGESSESWIDWIQIFRPEENLEENGQSRMENGKK